MSCCDNRDNHKTDYIRGEIYCNKCGYVLFDSLPIETLRPQPMGNKLPNPLHIKPIR